MKMKRLINRLIYILRRYGISETIINDIIKYITE